jgi:hypothetical protein
MDLTVLIPHLPERGDLLEDLLATIPGDVKYMVFTDVFGEGVTHAVNWLAKMTRTEWIMPMGDDDLFYEHHFEVIENHLSEESDIIYPWCRVTGPRAPFSETALQRPFDPELLKAHNYIPGGGAAIRRSLWNQLGGYRDTHNEDHDFWKRAVQAGARFHNIELATWEWRLGDWEHLCLK